MFFFFGGAVMDAEFSLDFFDIPAFYEGLGMSCQRFIEFFEAGEEDAEAEEIPIFFYDEAFGDHTSSDVEE